MQQQAPSVMARDLLGWASGEPSCSDPTAASVLRAMNAGSPFHPSVSAWFDRSFPAPTAPQAEAWPAIKAGRHVLIAAPTGSGKTLAAFLAAIDGLGGRGA